MTYKSEIAAAGYTWIWRGDDNALLRAADGGVERWRVAVSGDNTETHRMMRTAVRVYTFARDASFEDLPLVGRLDLTAGQIVEVLAANWLKRGYTHGVIESVYMISGGPKYRVRLDTHWLVSFQPKQVKVYVA